MEENTLKNINDYDPLVQLSYLKNICNQIYIARNITLSNEKIVECLKKIDILFKDTENWN